MLLKHASAVAIAICMLSCNGDYISTNCGSEVRILLPVSRNSSADRATACAGSNPAPDTYRDNSMVEYYIPNVDVQKIAPS
jgi:hypothetical protein